MFFKAERVVDAVAFAVGTGIEEKDVESCFRVLLDEIIPIFTPFGTPRYEDNRAIIPIIIIFAVEIQAVVDDMQLFFIGLIFFSSDKPLLEHLNDFWIGGRAISVPLFRLFSFEQQQIQAARKDGIKDEKGKDGAGNRREDRENQQKSDDRRQ